MGKQKYFCHYLTNTAHKQVWCANVLKDPVSVLAFIKYFYLPGNGDKSLPRNNGRGEGRGCQDNFCLFFFFKYCQ